MSQEITPYRTPSFRVQEPTKQYGLIVKAKHKCSLPGFWKRLFYGVKSGDLVRCKECSQVWEWGLKYETMCWVRSSLEDWLKAGGTE